MKEAEGGKVGSQGISIAVPFQQHIVWVAPNFQARMPEIMLACHLKNNLGPLPVRVSESQQSGVRNKDSDGRGLATNMAKIQQKVSPRSVCPSDMGDRSKEAQRWYELLGREDTPCANPVCFGSSETKPGPQSTKNITLAV